MALRDIIAAYHDLLTSDRAAETQGQLDEQMRRRGLFFGERPLCSVLRPRFLTPQQYATLQRETRPLLSAFQKAYRAALADTGIRAQFGLLPWEEELIAQDPGFGQPSPTGRLDTFLNDDASELKMVEYNAETPAAPAYNDVLTEVFLPLPIMRDFLRDYAVRPLPARHNVLHALLTSYEQWGRSTETPQIAILDWREVPTYSEHLLFADYFNAHGYPTITADPRAVEYRDGKLIAGDFHITLIYKRVLISELIERAGMDSPVVRAVRDGAVCMVNPFRCKILHKKASLAVLSDERNAHLFSADEQRAIAAHIPWTRVVTERRTAAPPSRSEEGRTDYAGQSVDLVPFILAQRERLVLKANDEYGGKGIYLGWETPADEWERAVQTALTEPFVVQERVAIPSEPYPTLVDGTLHIFDRILDTAPFVFGGAYVDGSLTRLSTLALVNVTAGGGSTVPTFIVEPR
ncbi:MAG: OrfE protein [Ktedonobacterales bacterium]|jgi:hypothetical protein|nr:MAG: OrfE protein [Ktedonobacterales bacterium]